MRCLSADTWGTRRNRLVRSGDTALQSEGTATVKTGGNQADGLRGQKGGLCHHSLVIWEECYLYVPWGTVFKGESGE